VTGKSYVRIIMMPHTHRDYEIDGDEHGGGYLEHESVVEGSEPQLANAKGATSLELLFLVPLVSSKGRIDGIHPQITLGYAGRLQVIWSWAKRCLFHFSIRSAYSLL
jgi:hypothetical protein